MGKIVYRYKKRTQIKCWPKHRYSQHPKQMAVSMEFAVMLIWRNCTS